jgi:hypothetical protein
VAFHIADKFGRHKTLGVGILYAMTIVAVLAVATRL